MKGEVYTVQDMCSDCRVFWWIWYVAHKISATLFEDMHSLKRTEWTMVRWMSWLFVYSRQNTDCYKHTMKLTSIFMFLKLLIKYGGTKILVLFTRGTEHRCATKDSPGRERGNGCSNLWTTWYPNTECHMVQGRDWGELILIVSIHLFHVWALGRVDEAVSGTVGVMIICWAGIACTLNL